MKLEQYISELLYQYDCVVVPSLGGFVANYKSATIHAVQNTFSPPSKSISFNKNLNANDGLLANLIAQKEGVDFDTAIKKIEATVAVINRDLKLKKRVSLNDVGTLFLDAENRTQFEPQNSVNYLLGSYGLAVFQKQPIQRATIEEKITKEFVDRTAPLVAVKSERSKKWKYAAALIPLAFLAGWMPSHYDMSADLSYANLNPFKPVVKSVYSPLKSDFVTNKEVKTVSVKEQIAAADKDAYFLAVTLEEGVDPITVKLKEIPVAEAVSTRVEVSKQELHYHIVAGCFSEKRNAKKMVKKLKNKGFDAFIVGKRKGLWAVSYNSFVTRKEAVNALEFAQDHNSKAWILNQ
ncbi:MAG: SPOR domain-containing protein [Vicingaceae bacterium]